MEISIPRVKFEEMRHNVCGQHIAKGYILNTVLFAGSEYVITGCLESNKSSNPSVSAYQVVHLSKYKEALKPLEYRMHFLAVDTGKREHSYKGMLTKHGRRILVFVGEEIRFHPNDEGTQIGLF